MYMFICAQHINEVEQPHLVEIKRDVSEPWLVVDERVLQERVRQHPLPSVPLHKADAVDAPAAVTVVIAAPTAAAIARPTAIDVEQ